MESQRPSATSTERRERKRLAAEEGAKALVEFEARDIAVRDNMARLRALRVAKESRSAQEVTSSPAKKVEIDIANAE